MAEEKLSHANKYWVIKAVATGTTLLVGALVAGQLAQAASPKLKKTTFNNQLKKAAKKTAKEVGMDNAEEIKTFLELPIVKRIMRESSQKAHKAVVSNNPEKARKIIKDTQKRLSAPSVLANLERAFGKKFKRKLSAKKATGSKKTTGKLKVPGKTDPSRKTHKVKRDRRVEKARAVAARRAEVASREAAAQNERADRLAEKARLARGTAAADTAYQKAEEARKNAIASKAKATRLVEIAQLAEEKNRADAHARIEEKPEEGQRVPQEKLRQRQQPPVPQQEQRRVPQERQGQQQPPVPRQEQRRVPQERQGQQQPPAPRQPQNPEQHRPTPTKPAPKPQTLARPAPLSPRSETPPTAPRVPAPVSAKPAPRRTVATQKIKITFITFDTNEVISQYDVELGKGRTETVKVPDGYYLVNSSGYIMRVVRDVEPTSEITVTYGEHDNQEYQIIKKEKTVTVHLLNPNGTSYEEQEVTVRYGGPTRRQEYEVPEGYKLATKSVTSGLWTPKFSPTLSYNESEQTFTIIPIHHTTRVVFMDGENTVSTEDLKLGINEQREVNIPSGYKLAQTSRRQVLTVHYLDEQRIVQVEHVSAPEPPPVTPGEAPAAISASDSPGLSGGGDVAPEGSPATAPRVPAPVSAKPAPRRTVATQKIKITFKTFDTNEVISQYDVELGKGRTETVKVPDGYYLVNSDEYVVTSISDNPTSEITVAYGEHDNQEYQIIKKEKTVTVHLLNPDSTSYKEEEVVVQYKGPILKQDYKAPEGYIVATKSRSDGSWTQIIHPTLSYNESEQTFTIIPIHHTTRVVFMDGENTVSTEDFELGINEQREVNIPSGYKLAQTSKEQVLTVHYLDEQRIVQVEHVSAPEPPPVTPGEAPAAISASDSPGLSGGGDVAPEGSPAAVSAASSLGESSRSGESESIDYHFSVINHSSSKTIDFKFPKNTSIDDMKREIAAFLKVAPTRITLSGMG